MEDNPADIRLAEEAIREASVNCQLAVARDGAQALQSLGDADAPLPDLIFLDLNLPKMRGDEVLRAVKEDPRLRSIPVLVLTTSTNRRDVAVCYDLHANCYIAKPLRLEDFIEVMSAIWHFWSAVVTLPSVSCEDEDDEQDSY